ncbi:AraC family transcriptional regulator [Paenibacillus spongiae]|uniref:AraC family transcriptional regulator n=1 Tax=Paenibacillus spongiae TaxID=2909671 RepID=A0ABY5S4I5_9BACL|nr:AraC family transcriptional regulator [Paenibacillus spongiae]UVI27480.1 AraC family transcriptional regulator [Paenibacillus spongiae]
MRNLNRDWVEGPWSAHIYSVDIGTYDSLNLVDRIFPYWIISYVKEGLVETSCRGETYTVRAGDVMLHPPHVPFSERANGSGVHLWMQATISSNHDFDLFSLYRVTPVVTVLEAEDYESVFRKLIHCWQRHDRPFRDLRLTACTLQLVEHILNGWERNGCPERPESFDADGSRFSRLLGHLASRLNEKLTREDMAALVRLNANYLDRAFKSRYGVTPMQMLRNLRLKHARLFLEQTDETIETIASRCGLTDASYLCKQFKKQYGELPGEYRHSVRANRLNDRYL